MKHELEEKKKIAKEAELYGHDKTVAGEDPDVAFRDTTDTLRCRRTLLDQQTPTIQARRRRWVIPPMLTEGRQG